MTRHRCTTCRQPQPRSGNCAGCVELRKLLSRLHRQDWIQTPDGGAEREAQRRLDRLRQRARHAEAYRRKKGYRVLR